MDDPVAIFDSLRSAYFRYLDSPFRLRYSALMKERRLLLDRDGQLYREPLYEPMAPYRSSGLDAVAAASALGAHPSVGEFLSQKLLEPDPRGRPRQLYAHQMEAWRRSREGQSVVVTSGTGSGKTECYLIPILASLVEEAEREWSGRCPAPDGSYWWNRPRLSRSPQRGHEQGVRPMAVRALLLYPLNALIEDQLGRIREASDSEAARQWMGRRLRSHRFWFGRYNSSTPVPGPSGSPTKTGELRKRLRQMETEWARAKSSALTRGERILSFFQDPAGSEMWSRWDSQETPPDILITNYSMLNIMLMREVEDSIFEHTKQWLASDRERHVFHLVVDELHTYRGTPGTEVGYLLRALYERIGLEPDSPQLRIIATSASIEEDESSRRYLQGFFGRSETSFAIIRGERASFPAGASHPAAHAAAFAAFGNDLDDPQSGTAAAIERLTQRLGVPAGQTAPARQLEECLSAVSAFGAVQDAAVRPLTLDELADGIFPGAGPDGGKPAARGLVRALILARNELGSAPLPLRAHFFFHNAGRLWACVNPDCAGRAVPTPAGEPSPPVGQLYAQPVPRCGACGSRVLELLYCQPCGEVFLGGFKRLRAGEPNSPYLSPDYPDLDRVPDRTSSLKRTFGEYALFWPARGQSLYQTNDAAGTRWEWTQDTVSGFRWKPARISHQEGRVSWPPGAAGSGRTLGYIFQSPSDDAGAFASRCPHCGEDWHFMRTAPSPIRDLGSGFQRVVQLLCDGLVRSMEKTQSRKLVLFSDSRQDAAKLATGIKTAHHFDVLRQIAFHHLAGACRQAEAAAGGRQTLFLLSVELLQLQRRLLGQPGGPLTAEENARYAQLLQQMPAAAAGAVVAHAAGGPAPEVLSPPPPPPAWTAVGFDPLCSSAREGLLALGMNPGGPKASLAGVRAGTDQRDAPWGSLVDWSASPRQFKHYSLLNAAEVDLKNKIDDALTAAMVESVLFAAGSRDFESLRLGLLWIGQTPPATREQEAAAAVVRILLGRCRRWLGSGREGKTDPPRVVKRYLKEAADFMGLDPAALTERVAAILQPCMHQWLVDSRSLFALAPRPGDDGCVDVFACGRCGRTHLHAAAGVCARCSARLDAAPPREAVDGEIADYYEFLARCDEPAFRLNCAELTGQTDTSDRRSRQRFFQEVFMDGESDAAEGVDLLSVTTTMEAGVDIGALQALAMANMPPVRFNYQQRVGRAGRRGLGLSIALTLCRGRSHDEYYFERPQLITAEPPPPPYVDVSREEIARRVVAKEVLRRAFRGIPANANEGSLGGDVHGEFGTVSQWEEGNRRYVEGWIRGNRPEIEQACRVVLRRTGMDTPNGHRSMADYVSTRLVNEVSAAAASDDGELGESLSRRCASRGVLPMFGFPTKVRQLHHRGPQARGHGGTIDRDLDVAISQFAPGAQTVKDDLLHTSIAVAEFIPDGNGMAEAVDPLRNTQALGVCRQCQALVVTNPVPGPCPCCQAPPDPGEGYGVVLASQPPGFCTFWRWQAEYDGSFEFTPRALRARIAAEPNRPISQANFTVDSIARCRVHKINDNEGESFRFLKWRGHEIYYTEEAVEQALRQLPSAQQNFERGRGPEADPDMEPKVRALAAISTTDVMTAGISHVPAGLCLNPAVDEAKAAWCSFGFMVRRAAAVRLDVAESEIEMGIQPYQDGGVPFRPPSARIFLSDTLENGAGYSALLGGPEEFEGLLRRILGAHPGDPEGRFHAPLVSEGHQQECATSCHRCLREYGNMPFHPILDWRLGLDMARLAMDATASIDFGQDYWAELVERQAPAYLKGHGLEVEMVGGLYCGVDETVGEAFIITHPLWDTEESNWCAPVGTAVGRLRARGMEPRCVSIFRAVRLPFEVPTV